VTVVTSHTEALQPLPAAAADEASQRLALRAKPLLALTQDAELLRTLASVTNPVHEVHAAASEIDFSAALMMHQAGVAVLDCAALTTAVGDLTQRLHVQFPELVLIVAGGAAEQDMLAAQITAGSVYRFLHKPVSEQRVRLFVEAAWRRHGAALALPAAGAPSSAARPQRTHWVLAALSALAVVAVPFLWLTTHPAAESLPHSAATAAAGGWAGGNDAALESLLARADRALAAGELAAPAGASAADLYREALSRSARDPRAVNGLEQVIEQLLAGAEAELQHGALDAAEQLAAQAHAIGPDHPRVAFIVAQIRAQRERAMLGKAQRTAAAGNVSAALAELDDASRSGHRSTLADEAREELTRRESETRLADLLNRARDALAHGRLTAPAEESARFYLDSARALAPDDPQVQQALQDLIARLAGKAREALAAKNAEAADTWTAAAADAGADRAQVAALREAARQLHAAPTAAAPAAAPASTQP